jgi:hypothetical protein
MRKSLSVIAFTGLCSVSSLALAAASSPEAPAPRAPATIVAQTSSKKQATAKPASTAQETKASKSNDQARYAEKEQSSQTAEDYKGGDTVVIGASTATAILAILLLIILI